MITPPALRAGDKIGIISTARKISKEELQPAIDFFEKHQFDVVLGKNLFEAENQFAGNDLKRASDLQTMIDDRAIKAVFCARGGYGTVRVVDLIDFSPLAVSPKWICGYSDVTVLHNQLQKMGFKSLHCSMPINFSGNTPESLHSIIQVLKGHKPVYQWPSHSFNRSGNAEGELIGGNLSVIYSQMGSPSALETSGKILFLEDLDEYLYHIDRMLQNFKRAGYFHKLSGLIIGGMSDMNDNTIPFGKTALEIINEVVSPYSFPVSYGFPAGHIEDNRSLMLGSKVKLEVQNQSHLQFL